MTCTARTDGGEPYCSAISQLSGSASTTLHNTLANAFMCYAAHRRGGPVVTSDDGELAGNWIRAELTDGSIRTIRIEGAAEGHILDKGVTPPSETWFSSESAFFSFVGGEPDSIDLANSVTLVYRAGGEAASREESNTVSGQHLVVRYEGGSIESVHVTGSVTGTYSYLER